MERVALDDVQPTAHVDVDQRSLAGPLGADAIALALGSLRDSEDVRLSTACQDCGGEFANPPLADP